MNPIKAIGKFIYFVIDDFKTDIIFLVKIAKGDKSGVRKVNWKEFLDFRDAFKQYWWFFLVVILAVGVGYVLASQRYEWLANEFILEYCTPEDLSMATETGFNFTLK